MELTPGFHPGLPSRKLTSIASVACTNSFEVSAVASGSPVVLPLARFFCLLGWFLFASFLNL